MTNREYLQKGIRFLNKQEEFKNIRIKGEVMRAIKKSSYYSTIYFKGYAKDQVELHGEATIYINFRDLTTKEQIIEALAHEATHITHLKVGIDYYFNLLNKYFGR